MRDIIQFMKLWLANMEVLAIQNTYQNPPPEYMSVEEIIYGSKNVPENKKAFNYCYVYPEGIEIRHHTCSGQDVVIRQCPFQYSQDDTLVVSRNYQLGCKGWGNYFCGIFLIKNSQILIIEDGEPCPVIPGKEKMYEYVIVARTGQHQKGFKEVTYGTAVIRII